MSGRPNVVCMRGVRVETVVRTKLEFDRSIEVFRPAWVFLSKLYALRGINSLLTSPFPWKGPRWLRSMKETRNNLNLFFGLGGVYTRTHTPTFQNRILFPRPCKNILVVQKFLTSM